MRTPIYAAIALISGTVSAQPITEIIAQSGPNLGSIDQQLSIAASGEIAFTGTNAAALSQLFLATGPGSFSAVSGNTSATRNYLGASIADNGTSVAARERVSGNPVQFIVRRWAIPGPVSTIVGSSVQSDFDSAQGFTDLNTSGVVAFPGLVGGSVNTALFGSSQRPASGTIPRLQQFTGVQLIRPKIAETGAIVYRGPTPAPVGQILVHTIGGAGNPERVVGSEFSSLGLAPAISPSGRVVAFAGNLSVSGAQLLITSQLGISYSDGTSLTPEPLTPGPGVFVALKVDAAGGSRWVVQRVAGDSGNGQFDPGEVGWTNGTDAGPFGDFAALVDSGLGVTDATCAEPTIGVAFIANVLQQNGQAGNPPAAKSVVLARVSLRPLGGPSPAQQGPAFDPARPRVVRAATFGRSVAVGQTIPGLPAPLQDVVLYNPINQARQVASWASSGSSSVAILRTEYERLFRQLRQDDGVWGGERIVPPSSGPATDTFQKSGCTITALAMVSSWMGVDTTPPILRDWLLQQKLLDVSNAQTQVEQFYVRSFPDGTGCCRVVRAIPRPAVPRNFNSIAETLRGGSSPVLLKVPSSTRDASRTKAGQGHYVLAYALSESAPTQGPVEPSDILIADPSIWSNSRYTDGVSGRWDRSGVLSGLTLADYFSRLNVFFTNVVDADPPCGPNPPASQWCPPRQRAGLRYDARAWFDTGRFERILQGGPTEEFFVPVEQRRKAITTFAVADCSLPAFEPTSLVLVASPLEIALIDPDTQQRYVSSLTIAEPGDILLNKVGADFSTSTDDADPSPATNLEFPPYRILVPQTLLRRTINVQLVGTGSGGYTVSYLPGAGELDVTAPLTGSIEPGQIVNGSFGVNVTANCDSIDFNNDGSLFDPTDIDAFLSVFSEGPCIPATATCGDVDFNNDTSLFDPCDIDSFLLVFSEGPCTLCGQ
jgi:hypothetical protein